MVLKFLRNKLVEVEPQADNLLKVSWRLTDDLLKMEVELSVQIPEMEIMQAEAGVGRFPTKGCMEADERIKMIEGVTIGSGLRKIVKGVLNENGDCSLLVDAVLESANAVILHFTRPGLQIMEAVEDDEQKLSALKEMVKSNPRLIRSCIAFQDDSPIMKGLEI